MITQLDQQGLDLARRIFDHFTKGGLEFAREIISLENQIQTNSAKNSDQHVKSVPLSEIVFPTSDITPDELGVKSTENALPLDQERTIQSDQDSLPF